MRTSDRKENLYSLQLIDENAILTILEGNEKSESRQRRAGCRHVRSSVAALRMNKMHSKRRLAHAYVIWAHR